MSAVDHEALAGSSNVRPSVPGQTVTLGLVARRLASTDRRLYLPTVAIALAGLAVGSVAAFENGAWTGGRLLATVAALAVALAVGDARRRTGRLDRTGGIVGVAWAVLALTHLALPEYLFGWQVNGVIHASAITVPLLLVTSAATLSWSIRRLFGDTPSAGDLSVYPLVALPVVVALVAYGLLLGRVVVEGAGGLSLDILLRPWSQEQVDGTFVYQAGLQNHLLGSLLLMALTCAISILPAIGVAVFMTEYPGIIARLIGFCTTMLRAISVFIIGIALVGAVGAASGLAPDSPISQLLRGAFVVDESGTMQAAKGSYLAAAAFLSLLVIPIVAKFTEEGLRSVPRDMREGSVAIGASTAYGLRRILLPWAAPSIVTGLLLGAAEAAGSLAIILFAAGNGEYGVGPTSPVTGLDYALFATRYGSQPFIASMGYRAPTDYAYTAALLLLVITLGLTVGAMFVRRRFARRYRGSLTLD
ncbi:MAG TPA: ABC transporter permease subunit [Candidatus Limnocylindrales bacterium]|nr:ABC transporter permease subunit [Candidatus Limnocylindrales bacterium]